MPPRGVCRTAFSSRLATTWCTRSGSPSAVRSGGLDRHRHGDLRAQCSCCSRTACASSGSTAELRALERHRARLEPRQVEQLLDQPAEPLDLGEHRAEGLGVGVGRRRRRGSRARAWSAVIGVRSSCDTLATRSRRTPVGLGELGGHLVERPGELADLVARRRRHPPVVVALGHRRTRPRPSRAAATSCPATRNHTMAIATSGGDDAADRRPHADLDAAPRTRTR